MKVIYLDNYARFLFFKNILKEEIINIDLFLCELPSVYKNLKNVNLPCKIISFSKLNQIKLRLLNFEFIKLESLGSISITKFIIWNGNHRNQPLVLKNINKNAKLIFIENTNINFLFQYGEEGINNKHEIFKANNSKNNLNTLNSEVLSYLKNANPSDPLDSSKVGREQYRRTFSENILDIFLQNKEITRVIKNKIYEKLNKLSIKVFNLIKNFRNNNKIQIVDCFLLQNHSDSNIVNSKISTAKIIRSLAIKKKSKIYIKPHPEDFLFAFYLRLRLINLTKFEYSANIICLSRKSNYIFHTINSSAGIFLNLNTKNEIKYYGQTPFTDEKGIIFTKNYLKNAEDLKKIICK